MRSYLSLHEIVKEFLCERVFVDQKLNLKQKPVRLINDLEAIARAVPILRPGDVKTINAGDPVSKGAIAVIAPGTGLGESFLTYDGIHYRSHSSEGGHSDLHRRTSGRSLCSTAC